MGVSQTTVTSGYDLSIPVNLSILMEPVASSIPNYPFDTGQVLATITQAGLEHTISCLLHL